MFPSRIAGRDRRSWRIEAQADLVLGLVPEGHPGDIVVMDNLSSHKGPKVRALIEADGGQLLFLPPTAPTSI